MSYGARRLIEWAVAIGIVLAMTITLRAFVFQTYFIPSGSMRPTLQLGDRIVIDKVSVDLGVIHVGDIIVFTAPPAVSRDCDDSSPDLVKRVIGLPGDRLWSRGNTIIVNGRALDERWSHTEPLGPAIGRLRVPPNDFFVMGDNHPNSCDSRTWGFVPRHDIIGKVFLRAWPPNRIHWF